MWRALAVLAVLTSTAHAAMMEHYDLTGLTMRSDTIAIAERTPGKGKSHYHIVKVVRGAPQADLDLDDSLYEMPPNVDKRVVIFLQHRDGAVWLAPSGLRVSANGKAFRYEQWNNPGGWTLVPQGPDPQDQWQGATTQLDTAGLDAAIGVALERVDSYVAAQLVKEPAKRRAAMLALLPAPGMATGEAGFYADVLAGEVETTLAGAGDIEGSLLAEARDHTPSSRRPLAGAVTALVDYARDTTHPAELRALAIDRAGRQFAFMKDPAAASAVLAMFADPSPAVRAAAVAAVARPAGAMSSDKKEDALLKKLASQARVATAKLYATETDSEVLSQIADAFENLYKRARPARRNAAPVAHVSVNREMFKVDVFCVGKQRFKNAKLVGKQGTTVVSIPQFSISPHCGDGSEGVGGGSTMSLAAGTYALELTAEIDRKPVVVPLGTFIRDANGETRRSP